MSVIPAVAATDGEPPRVVSAGARRFRLGRRVHCGRETSVYQAVDIDACIEVALKRVRGVRCNDATAHARIEYEAAVLGRLDHPTIVKCLGAPDWADANPFVIMEYVDGIDLGQLLHRPGSASGSTPEQIARIGAACAAALVACHEARWSEYDLCITHGRIEAENVMVTREGYVKLIDFGDALWSFRDPDRPHDPEIAQNVRRDVVDLGLLLYQLGIGSPLGNDRRPLSEHVDDLSSLPRRLRQIIARTLESGPVPWYQNMRDLYEDLVEILLAWDVSDHPQELAQLFEQVPSSNAIPTSWFGPPEPNGERETERYLNSAESRRVLRYSDAGALNTWLEDYQRTAVAR